MESTEFDLNRSVIKTPRSFDVNVVWCVTYVCLGNVNVCKNRSNIFLSSLMRDNNLHFTYLKYLTHKYNEIFVFNP